MSRRFEDQYATDKKYCKVQNHFYYTGEYRGTAHSMCSLKYSIPKEITIHFYNGSNYDYHIIKEEPVEKFERQFTCLGEFTKKYVTFLALIEKEVKIIVHILLITNY